MGTSVRSFTTKQPSSYKKFTIFYLQMETLDADVAPHHLLPLHRRRRREATSDFSCHPPCRFCATAHGCAAAIPRHSLPLVLDAQGITG